MWVHLNYCLKSSKVGAAFDNAGLKGLRVAVDFLHRHKPQSESDVQFGLAYKNESINVGADVTYPLEEERPVNLSTQIGSRYENFFGAVNVNYAMSRDKKEEEDNLETSAKLVYQKDDYQYGLSL